MELGKPSHLQTEKIILGVCSTNVYFLMRQLKT